MKLQILISNPIPERQHVSHIIICIVFAKCTELCEYFMINFNSDFNYVEKIGLRKVTIIEAI